MVAIVIQDFGGRMPRRNPRLLPDNYSQVAENVKLIYGDLRGYNDFRLIYEFPTSTFPRRVWHIKNTAQTLDAWYGSPDPTAVLLKSPLINDAYDRYYLFQPGQPPRVNTFARISSGLAFYNLSFPQPTIAPTLVQTGGASSNRLTRVYVYTFVTEWGEESRISPTTSINVREDVTSVDVECTTGSPVVDGRDFEFVRIYRTVTGQAGAQFYWVADVPWVIGSVTYVDTRKDTQIVAGSTLSASQNDPPVSGLRGARVLGNGALVAFKGRDIHFSVPYLPHAWPEDWRLSLPDVIVGLEVMGENIMVLTTGSPVIVYGTYPDNMGIQKFGFPDPCVGYGTIVAAPEGVYFAAHSGLKLMTPTGVEAVTDQIISRNDWVLDYADPSTRAERLTSRYIASKNDTKGYIIDGLEARIALTDLVGWVTVGDINIDTYTGDVLAISGDAVYSWDDPEEIEADYRWKSKKFVLQKPASMAALMLHIEPREDEWIPSTIYNPGYDFPDGMDKKTQMLVRVWGDGDLIFERAVSDREQCRLPSDTMYMIYEVEVQGQCRVHRIAIAETGRELETV